VACLIKTTDLRTLVLLLILIITFQVSAQVKVKGYYKKDGTYVQPHYRSNPDGNPYNNWSYPGNTNPYTGKTATGNPDTYLKNYNNRSSNSTNPPTYPYSSTTFPTPSNSSYSNSPFYSSYYVTANSLNVRSGPSTNYSVVGTLSYADNVQVIESYTNGWKKIQYSYLDMESYSLSYNTKEGYVSGSYLSASNPYFKESYSTTSYSNSYYSNNTYSTIKKTSYPYGYGNGNITIWTDCGNDGEIKIYLDGVYIGKLTQYFREGTPDCGASGTLSVNTPAGTYLIEGRGNEYVWSGTITITKDRCLIQGLQK